LPFGIGLINKNEGKFLEETDKLETDHPKSKSQLKRESLALQELGKQLTELSVDRLERIRMSADLREAVLFAKSIKSRGALRRQLQTIGSLMREVDAEPIRNALEDFAQGSKREARHFQKLERWRNALIGDDEQPAEEIIDDIVKEFPGADRQRLRQLASNARKEREVSKPPKSSRTLFRYLKEISVAGLKDGHMAHGGYDDGTDE
jgi:ribosome-associated protein